MAAAFSSIDDEKNFSLAISFFRVTTSKAGQLEEASSGDLDFSRTVCGDSVDVSDTPSNAIFLLDWLVIGAVVVVKIGVFDTFEIVTVVRIDCFSTERCLLSVASDMTIWSQCDERSFFAYNRETF